jgi:hypothetical protein
VLLLGSSNDEGHWFEGGKKRHELAAERLEADLGEPVEVVVKGIWPTADIADVVGRWMDKYRPDVVYLNTGSYWYLYRSVPLRLQRWLGRFGRPIGAAGFRFADSRRWAHNAVFRSIRSALQNTIGGDTHFTADEVVERMTECLRVCVRSEGVAVVMKGPHGRDRYTRWKGRFARDEAIRLRVHRELEAACGQLHVTYDGVGDGGVRNQRAYRRGTTAGDGLHGNAIRHEHEGDVLYRGLRQALQDSGRLPAPASEPVAVPTA